MGTYHLFISHAWKYSDDYERVVKWLESAQSIGRLDWKNYSDPKSDPIFEPDERVKKQKMKEQLRRQISLSSVVIVIAGMYAHANNSEWIDFEIDTAIEMGKHIICLRLWSQQRLPEKISNCAHNNVGWNYESLVQAIFDSRS